jgi:hypothetical protein
VSERRLSSEERGAVLAAVLAAGSRAPEILARLADGAACVAEARRLNALPRAQRIEAVVAEGKQLLADLPAGLAHVHESWIEAALVGESEAVRRQVAGSSGASEGVRRWLRRRVLGGLVAMPDGALPVGRPPRVEELPVLEPARLVAAFESVGRRRLALALQAAGPAALAALAGRLGPPHGRLLLEVARRPGSREEIRVAVKDLAELVAGDAALLLFRAGARTVAPGLVAAGGDLACQLAQRLPRDRGLLLLDEVRRATPRDDQAARLELLIQATAS